MLIKDKFLLTFFFFLDTIKYMRNYFHIRFSIEKKKSDIDKIMNAEYIAQCFNLIIGNL